jgi:hypothetical protein
VIFPEGTRYNPDDAKRLAKSKEIARSNNLQPLEYHLTPRSRGSWLVLQSLHSRMDAIYDITVGYSGSECGKGLADTKRNKAPQLIGKIFYLLYNYCMPCCSIINHRVQLGNLNLTFVVFMWIFMLSLCSPLLEH